MNHLYILLLLPIFFVSCQQSDFLGQKGKKDAAQDQVVSSDEYKRQVQAELVNTPLIDLHDAMIERATDEAVILHGVRFSGMKSLLVALRDQVSELSANNPSLSPFTSLDLSSPTVKPSASQLRDAFALAAEKIETLKESQGLALLEDPRAPEDNCLKFTKGAEPGDELSIAHTAFECLEETMAPQGVVGVLGHIDATKLPKEMGAAGGFLACQVSTLIKESGALREVEELRKCEETSKKLDPSTFGTDH